MSLSSSHITKEAHVLQGDFAGLAGYPSLSWVLIPPATKEFCDLGDHPKTSVTKFCIERLRTTLLHAIFT